MSWITGIRALARVTSRFAFVSIVGVSAGCAVQGESSESVSTVSDAIVTVVGTVTDQGGIPVADVQIQALDAIGDKIGAGISQADGSYSLDPTGTDIPDGTYDIVVTPPAGSIYVPQTFPGTSLSGNSRFDIVLVNASAAYTVSGRILDRGGSPVSGQNVCLSGTNGGCMSTAADGTYDFTVPAGTYYLRLDGYRYPSGGGYSYFDLYESTPIAVSSNLALGDRTLETRALTGTVVDAGGAVVPNASVTANWLSVSFGSFQGSWFGNTTAGSDGRFALTGFPSSGTVNATGSGLPTGTTNVTIVGDTDITVTLPASYAVTGRILDRGGSPVSGQNVCLSGNNGSCATTAADGTYSLAVAAGSYYLRLDGYRYPSGGGYSYFDLYESTPIAVSSNLALGDRTLETRALTGTVVDAGGAVVPNASVTANWLSVSFGSFQGSWFGNTTAGSDGRFALTGFPSSGTVNATGSGLPTGTTNVTIVGDTDITVTLPASYAVTGRILDRLGSPVSGQNVCLSGNNGSCAMTAADGTYSLAVAAGSYYLRLDGYRYPSGGGYSYFDLYESTPIAVSSNLALGDRTLQTRVVAGRVLDPDGMPKQGASVTANWLSVSFGSFQGSWYGNTSTAADGRFVFTGFPSTGAINITPPASSGLVPFAINNVQISGDYAVGVSTQFLAETATAVIGPGEKLTTDDEGDQATPADPVETTVILALLAPIGSTVIIQEGPVTVPPPFGYRFLTQQIDITAPGSTDPTDPLVINFQIDCSRFLPAACDQTTANSVILFRNGVQVNECNVPGAGNAIPSPCVDDRRVVANNNISITVNTLAASSWNFALKLDEDADGDRILDADDACPNQAEDVDGNEDTDGCPELEDQDGDGIEDFFDLCPTQAEDLDGNADADGCPEVDDSDGDGLDDGVDVCPDEPEDLDGHDDDDGCPETEPAPVPCADFTGDGRVTRRDLRELEQRLGAREGQRRYRARFDLNDDGRISNADLRLARRQLGDHCHR